MQTLPFNRLMSRIGSANGLHAHQRILVCGTHRSGSTVLGELLATDPRSQLIFEPFNTAFGIEEATQSFVAGDWPDNDWPKVIDRFIAADGIRFRCPTPDRRSLSRWIKSTRLARQYTAARLFRPQRLVLKANYLSLSSQYLIARHRIQTVFAVKHPAAFFVSLRRVGWHDDLPLDDLVAQGVITGADCDAATTPAARAGLFWNVINRHALETQRRFPTMATIWSHERFCSAPDVEMTALTAALRLDYSPAMRRAVSRATLGKVVRPPQETVHELVRNTAGMVDDWRNQLSPDEEAGLRDRCSELYRELIGIDW